MARNEISIQELIDAVSTADEQKHRERLIKLKRTNERMKEFAILHEVHFIDRIKVIPSNIEQEVVTHRTYNKWLNKWDEETETVKEKKLEVQNIIEALKACKPDEVENNIHWFNNGRFYFVTDKGMPYNLRSFPRPLTNEEEKEIQTLIEEIKESKLESEKELFSARILIAIDTPDTFRTPEQEKELNSGEGLLERMELSKIIEREKKRNKFFNYETWKKFYLKDANKNKEEHLQKVNQSLEKICAIYDRCEDEQNFFIHPLKPNKQLKIYISKRCEWFFQKLGYSVREEERTHKTKKHKESHGEIVEEEFSYSKKSYYFQINLKAFVSSCKAGKVARKGFYFDDEGNELELLSGRPNEEVTIIDENGHEMKFQSKTDAAKHFKLSNAQITQIVSNGGKLNRKKKEIKVKIDDGSILEFKSLSEMARKINENKMSVSRAFKNKQKGDFVVLSGVSYELL